MDNIAIFTMSKDEKVFFPIWYKYYSKYFKKNNIYVLDNNTIDDSLKNGYTSLTFPSKRISISQLNKSKFIKIPVKNKFVYDVWYVDQVSFLVDLKILLLTVKRVFKSEGITNEGQSSTEAFKGNY